ncbi:hypothetical protein P153DRAFT_379666 [Dothidotthia symphoricarpi CBS 119687]|uniref:1-alkyl-2-acetylglycerophosphocholine esterase n=1 Tax=Dothidotthia symphoricarpi CBS 119687 TaxID=1392245 RepID=A0A6A6A0K9_9PLEO|nr:uncharacterized protein P153DRAFT_379666 [Dothidotthia symphoricarpi CBS 119687]KAF2124111.1 hypothetical protein P153DRAFT_379666 [Dothidotthia symphoricarpi CBS 119687]
MRMLCYTTPLLGLVVSATFTLPQGSGPYHSSLTIYELTDTSRLDPFNATHLRRLMISRFDPILAEQCSLITTPYFSPATAAEENQILAEYDYPPIFDDFNLEEIASHGFVVITIDHPYDVDVVEFPDGTVIYGGRVDKPTANSSASVEHALEVRARDVSFVLDTLGSKLGDDVVMFGHSFGGAAVATSMLRDRRISAGVNLDGIMFGPVLQLGLGNASLPWPFVLWGSDGHDSSTDESWGLFWSALGSSMSAGYRKEFTITDSAHGSYWDLNVLVDVAGIREELSETAQWLIGPLPGSRVWETLGRYLSSYFLFALGKVPEDGILKGPSDEFPEVSILRG